MKHYFKRLLNHPGFGLAIIYGIFISITLLLIQVLCFYEKCILGVWLFVLPWLFIVLITNFKH